MSCSNCTNQESNPKLELSDETVKTSFSKKAAGGWNGKRVGTPVLENGDRIGVKRDGWGMGVGGVLIPPQ